MKKYFVILNVNSHEFGLSVLARDSKVAQNKAVRHAKHITGDKQIKASHIVSVTYEGFYLARRFFAVF